MISVTQKYFWNLVKLCKCQNTEVWMTYKMYTSNNVKNTKNPVVNFTDFLLMVFKIFRAMYKSLILKNSF